MSEPSRPLSETDEADLAALADGRLDDAARRAELESRIEADSELERAFARQRAGLAAIVAAGDGVSAPLALRTRVEEMQRKAAEPRPRPRLRMPSPRRWIPAAALAAAAAVAVVVVLALGGAPSTESIVAAALRPPVAAVTLDPSQPALLEDNVEGVQFPNYQAKLGWEADGTRTDEFSRRDTRTVFYTLEGNEVAYTIVAGEQLDWPPEAEVSTVEGVELRTFQEGDRTVVTWLRDGRTCVMSSADVDAATLQELAAWKGAGAVTF